MPKYISKSSSKKHVKQNRLIKKRSNDTSLPKNLEYQDLSVDDIKKIIQSDKIKHLHFKGIALLQEKLFYDTHSDEQLRKEWDDVNSYFSPFIHGTSTAKSKMITDDGVLKPRGRKGSTYKGHLSSLPDRIYFASWKHDPEFAVHRCIQVLEENCRESGEEPWENGYVYILNEIPEEFYNKMGFDEDAFSYDWYEYEDIEDDDRIRDLVWGVGQSNSIAIKKEIPVKYLTKLTARDFFNQYITKTSLGQGRDWEEFRNYRKQEIEKQID
jgi:hypothetical protein